MDGWLVFKDFYKLLLMTHKSFFVNLKLKNENYFEFINYAQSEENFNAIYAHSYDPSGNKMLTAGGPLTVGLYGHCFSVWK